MQSAELSSQGHGIVEASQVLGAGIVGLETTVCHTERILLRQGSEPRLHRGGMVSAELDDGTSLSLETMTLGDPDGWPVFSWPGVPGSVLDPSPEDSSLFAEGIKYIKVSRPGYGKSARHAGRIVADSATYLESVAKAYGITRCSVIGRSGGGPSALACAALLPELVVNTAIFSGTAPGESIHDWSNGMSEDNQRLYDMAGSNSGHLLAKFKAIARASERNPEVVLEIIESEMSLSDKSYLRRRPDIRNLIALSHAYAMKYGPWGRYDDVIATKSLPWGFDLQEITVPVLLAQGRHDTFTPVEHFEQLMTDIPTATGDYYDNVGHMEILELVPEYIGRLRDQAHALLAA